MPNKPKKSKYRHLFATSIAVVFILVLAYGVNGAVELAYLNSILAVSRAPDDTSYLTQAISSTTQSLQVVCACGVSLLGVLASALISSNRPNH